MFRVPVCGMQWAHDWGWSFVRWMCAVRGNNNNRAIARMRGISHFPKCISERMHPRALQFEWKRCPGEWVSADTMHTIIVIWLHYDLWLCLAFHGKWMLRIGLSLSSKQGQTPYSHSPKSNAIAFYSLTETNKFDSIETVDGRAINVHLGMHS